VPRHKHTNPQLIPSKIFSPVLRGKQQHALVSFIVFGVYSVMGDPSSVAIFTNTE